MVRIAVRHGRTASQVAFRFALDVGMMPLTGTTNADHMRADLECFDFSLEHNEVEQMKLRPLTSRGRIGSEAQGRGSNKGAS